MRGGCLVAPLSQFNFFLPLIRPRVCLSICTYVYVYPFCLFASEFTYVIISWLFPLNWCFEWNYTPSNFYYLYYLDSVDILVNSALGALDVRAIKTGAQGTRRQITQYSHSLYRRCKVQTTGLNIAVTKIIIKGVM